MKQIGYDSVAVVKVTNRKKKDKEPVRSKSVTVTLLNALQRLKLANNFGTTTGRNY